MQKATKLPAEQAALAALYVAHKLANAHDEQLSGFIAKAPGLAGISSISIAAGLTVAAEIADAPDGLDTLLELIADSLDASQSETVYALTADYIAENGRISQEEMHFIERLGEALRLDRLTRAAFDRAARTRTMRLTENGETDD